MSKHTPIPWRAQDWMEDNSTARLLGPRGETLAVFYDVRDEGPRNLALAAIAPELLEALKNVMGLHCAHPRKGEPWVDTAARAVIAKAEEE